MKSKSYKTATCCRGHDCDYLSLATENEPCWGQVEVIGEEGDEEDWYWIHGCKGHARFIDGDKYVKEVVKND